MIRLIWVFSLCLHEYIYHATKEKTTGEVQGETIKQMKLKKNNHDVFKKKVTSENNMRFSCVFPEENWYYGIFFLLPISCWQKLSEGSAISDEVRVIFVEYTGFGSMISKVIISALQKNECIISFTKITSWILSHFPDCHFLLQFVELEIFLKVFHIEFLSEITVWVWKKQIEFSLVLHFYSVANGFVQFSLFPYMFETNLKL